MLACQGDHAAHVEVVELLLQADVDKDMEAKVRSLETTAMLQSGVSHSQ